MATIHDRVSDWRLERLAAGELPENQAEELRDRLKAQGEEGRVSALATSNAEILAELPPDRIVPEIQRRVASTSPATVRRSRRPLWSLSLVTACAAGLAMMLAVRDRKHATNPTLPTLGTEQPEAIGIKGDLKPALRIYRKTGASSELLRAQATVRRGDILQIRYVAADKRFGAIASIDARGLVTFHLPESEGPAVVLDREGERALPHAYELDDSPGFERFFFVTSAAPFTTGEVVHALKNGSTLPTPLALFEIALKKETP